MINRLDSFRRLGTKTLFPGLLVAWLTAGLLTGACATKEDGAAHMPPATGPGAPPRKELPALPGKVGEGASEAAAAARETTGTTFPRAQAQVGPNMSGVLASIAVEEGDRVKKGDLLFRLRSQDFDLRVQQAQAALKSAEVGLSAIKVEYDRTQRLVEKNAINQAAWDQVQAQYQGAQAGVDQARVAVAMAQKARADAVVRSPIGGVVTAKLKSVGEMVTMMPPSIIVIIEDHSVLELRFRLPEQDVSSLAPGHMVQAEFSALGATVESKVVRISPNVDPMTRTIEVVTEIPNDDGRLKAGMLATVRVGGAAAAPAEADPAAAPAGAQAANPAAPAGDMQ